MICEGASLSSLSSFSSLSLSLSLSISISVCGGGDRKLEPRHLGTSEPLRAAAIMNVPGVTERFQREKTTRERRGDAGGLDQHEEL